MDGGAFWCRWQLSGRAWSGRRAVVRVAAHLLVAVALTGCDWLFYSEPHERVIAASWSPNDASDAAGTELALVVHSYTKTRRDTPYYVPDDKVDHQLRLVTFDAAQLENATGADGALNVALGTERARISQDEGLAGSDEYEPSYWFPDRGYFIGADARGPFVWPTDGARVYVAQPSVDEFVPFTDTLEVSGIDPRELAEGYQPHVGALVSSADGTRIAVVYLTAYRPNLVDVITNEVIVFFSVAADGQATHTRMARISELSLGSGDGVPMDGGLDSVTPYPVENPPFYRLMWGTHPTQAGVVGVTGPYFRTVPDNGTNSVTELAMWFVPLDVPGEGVLAHGSRGERLTLQPRGTLPGPIGRVSQSGRAVDIEFSRTMLDGLPIDGDRTTVRLRTIADWSPWAPDAWETIR